MPTGHISVGDINQKLSERFAPASRVAYSSVIVLLLYWKDSDRGFKTEADKLRVLFEQKFNFAVLPFEIPSVDSTNQLNWKIVTLVRDFSKPRSLIIIHYGGHGASDEVRQLDHGSPRRQSVWAADTSQSETEVLKWSCIQPQLGLGQGDFLVVLDCCYGAQASRAPEPRVIPHNVELLAAAPMGCLTAGPGRFSFTTAFTKEVEAALESSGNVKIRDLHHRLAAGDQKTVQTPVYFAHGTKTTICLEPLPPPQKTAIVVRDPATTLMMRMMVSSPLDHHLLDQIIEWLGNLAPPEVSNLQVTDLVHRASAAQHFILEEAPTRPSPVSFVKLPNPSKTEVKDAWSFFNWGLRESLSLCISSWIPSQDDFASGEKFPWSNGEIADEECVANFLESFDKNIALLERVIERNLLAVPELQEELHLADAIQDHTAKELGLVRSLQLRLGNVRFKRTWRDPSATDTKYLRLPTESKLPVSGSFSCKEYPKFGRVMVEYYVYTKVDDEGRQRFKTRMDHLVNMLSEPDSAFHTPHCLGWTDEPERSRYALIFQNPRDDSYVPIRLYDILNPTDGNRRPMALPPPSLGQRFKLAQAIGQTLSKWHDVGWVYESISSLNVIFFHKADHSGPIDYSNFYLCGFSFSRLESHHSTPRRREEDVLRDLYQHPTRQGNSPVERHTKEHDIYSFGVLLFEIGFWDCVPNLFPDLVRTKRTELVRDRMLARIDALGQCMGTAFLAAARLCLSNGLGIQMDDKVQSGLARAFEHQVLRRLEAGTKLDSNAPT